MQSQPKAAGEAASRLISEKIAALGDWRGDALARMRGLIKEADPDVLEEWKWMGTPVWSHDGGLCTGESYKEVVKLTFFKGASLKDPAALFNSSLDGNTRRAIDIHEGEEVDAKAFKTLIRAAVALNASGGEKPAKEPAQKPAPTLTKKSAKEPAHKRASTLTKKATKKATKNPAKKAVQKLAKKVAPRVVSKPAPKLAPKPAPKPAQKLAKRERGQ